MATDCNVENDIVDGYDYFMECTCLKMGDLSHTNEILKGQGYKRMMNCWIIGVAYLETNLDLAFAFLIIDQNAFIVKRDGQQHTQRTPNVSRVGALWVQNQHVPNVDISVF